MNKLKRWKSTATTCTDGDVKISLTKKQIENEKLSYFPGIFWNRLDCEVGDMG